MTACTGQADPARRLGSHPNSDTARGGATASTWTVWALATFVLYAVLFLAFRLSKNPSPAAVLTTVVPAVADLLCGATLVRVCRQAPPSERRPWQILAVASFLMALVNVTWGLRENLFGYAEFTPLDLLLNRFPYTTVLFLWVCFWLIRIRAGGSEARRGDNALVISAGIFGLALTGIFLLYFREELSARGEESLGQLFVIAFVFLEVTGLALSTVATLLDPQYPIFVGYSYAVMVSVDLVFNAREFAGTVVQNSLLEMGWTFSQLLMALAVARVLDPIPSFASSRKSRFSVAFLPATTIALGTTALSLIPVGRINQFAMSLAVLSIGIITLHLFGRWYAAIVDTALEHAFSQTDSDAIERLIPSTSRIAPTFAMFHYIFATTRSRCLYVGDSMLFNAAASWSVPKTHVLLCMPYKEPWADAVHSFLRDSFTSFDVPLIRADESVRNPDVPDEIWSLICSSRAIVADLTGLTPNVLYEVGVAHALGRSVILLRQPTTKVPFNIATRRCLTYSIDSSGRVSGLDVGRIQQALLGEGGC